MTINRYEQFKMMTWAGRLWLIGDMTKIVLLGYKNNLNALGRLVYGVKS